MREEVQLVKKSKIVRKPKELSVDAFSETIPKEISKMGVQGMRINKFYYNGGLELVNYGLNTFVKELYVIYKYDSPMMCLCSDRFNNYYKILDEEIVTLIDFSQLCISPEGVLIFYTKREMYVTLNCKIGRIIEYSNIIDTNNMEDAEIVVLDGNTFIKVTYKNHKSEIYYRLDFSFNFFTSYGTQIGINVLDSNYSETNEFPRTIVKSNKLKSIYIDNKYIPYKDLKKKFSGLLCRKNLTIKYKDYYADVYGLWHLGDTRIDDCINSFARNIYFINVDMREKFNIFSAKEIRKSAVISVDRFGQKYINEELHKSIACSEFYVSIEGVIMGISDKNQMLISLDGILWKHIDLVSALGLNNYCYSIDFTCKNGNNYILVIPTYKERNEKSYLIKFSFNFIDLYESPVEVSFEDAECVDERNI